MKNSFGRSLSCLTASLLILSVLFVNVSAQQRAIVNPSTELPVLSDNSNERWGEGAFPGWLTTHPQVTNRCENGTTPSVTCRPMERWSTEFNSVLTASGAGTMFVELAADTRSMIYQPICMANGETFSYSFLHRGRSSATTADVAEFRLGIPTGLPTGSKPSDSYSFPIVRVSTTSNATGAAPTGNGTINTPVNAGNGWRRYSGRYTYTGTTRLVNMGFSAVSAAGNDLSIGNFIDDWQIQLSPYVELQSSTAAGNEGSGGGSNSPANRPSIRIGGQVITPVTVTVNVTGGTATIGTDYSMTVPFAAGNTTTSTVVTIPAGTYDGASASSIFPINFSISRDGSVEPNETVTFQVGTVTGATTTGIASCGTAAVVNMSYTINNDDSPTAASVLLSGRVVTSDGRGISGAVLTLVSGRGLELYARTNPFGYYRFEGIEAGDFAVVTVGSKRFQFSSPTQSFMVGDSISDVDFIADPR